MAACVDGSAERDGEIAAGVECDSPIAPPGPARSGDTPDEDGGAWVGRELARTRSELATAYASRSWRLNVRFAPPNSGFAYGCAKETRRDDRLTLRHGRL